MSLYSLPDPSGLFSSPRKSSRKKRRASLITSVIIISVVVGTVSGSVSGALMYYNILPSLVGLGSDGIDRIIERERVVEKEYVAQTTHEQRIIDAVKEISPAVVSIVITKDVPIIEQYYVDPFNNPLFGLRIPQQRQIGTEKQEVGGGSGFLVTKEGLVMTNKHVVLDEDAEYTVFTNDGKSYPAKVLAKDPFQDLAILEIDQESIVDEEGTFTKKPFPVAPLGNSDGLEIGQTVIAIGNALGTFRNTVSIGVISGVGRTITASGGSFVETIEDVLQTDAAINRGNSGGPLLNLAGEVVGINTATVTDAQSIGFAIPANKVKRDIAQVKETGKITYPLLGIRYSLVTDSLQESEGLPVNYGAYIQKGAAGEPGIVPGSAAAEAGLLEGDIILEFEGERISTDNTLAKLINLHDPFDTVTIKVMRNGSPFTINVVLGERAE